MLNAPLLQAIACRRMFDNIGCALKPAIHVRIFCAHEGGVRGSGRVRDTRRSSVTPANETSRRLLDLVETAGLNA
jgi:hypothetical protein